jgi:hypothetical protein
VTKVLPADGSLASNSAPAEVCASPTSANRDAGGTIYACVSNSLMARVVAIDAATGNVRVLYSGTGGAQGMVVGSRNVIAYGVENTLKLISVDGGVLKSYPLPGYPGRPCYDPTTNRFFVTTTPAITGGVSYLLGFDSP